MIHATNPMRALVYALAACVVCQQCWASSKGKPAAKHAAAGTVDRGVNLVRQGKELFEANQCLDCHRLGGKGCADGVVLDGVGQKRTARFLRAQLQDPEEHVARAAREFKGEPNLMTAPNLSKPEIDAVVAYLKSMPAVKARPEKKRKDIK